MEMHVPESITLALVSTAAIIATLIASVTALLLAIAEAGLKNCRASFYKIWPALMGYSIPITLVAYLAGHLTSYSRVGAVGNVIPAVLALVGGLNIYVFGSDNKHKNLVAYCVCLFTVVLFYGTQSGAYKREVDREARLMELIRQEIKIRAIRKNLNLPDEFPAWMVSTEPK